MKKSKDPPDFREQCDQEELKRQFSRRSKADLRKDPRHRFLTRVIWIVDIGIIAAIVWALWLTYKFLIEKGII